MKSQATCECITLYIPNRNLISSRLDNLQLRYPLPHTQADDRLLTVAASKEWNNLPLSENQSQSIHLSQFATYTPPPPCATLFWGALELGRILEVLFSTRGICLPVICQLYGKAKLITHVHSVNQKQLW